MSRALENYLEELAGMQPQVVATDSPPSRLEINNEPPGSLVQPESPSQREESISTELQSYIRQCVLDTVAHAMTTTVIPDVVESTLARVRAEGLPEKTSIPVETSATTPAVQQVKPTPSARAEAVYYETPVPTLHTSNQQYRRQRTADLVCWGGMTAIIAMMGSLAFYSIRQSPQTQTVQQNQQLNQSNQALSERLVESNAQVLESKQRCGNFSLICTIKE